MCWPSKVPEHTIFGMLKTCFRRTITSSSSSVEMILQFTRSGTKIERKACTSDQVARELQFLAGAMKRAAICGIPFRAGLQSVSHQANDLLRQSHTNYSLVGMSKGLHRVNDRYGTHLSNWQLGKFMMTLGQRFGWPKRSQQCATKKPRKINPTL